MSYDKVPPESYPPPGYQSHYPPPGYPSAPPPPGYPSPPSHHEGYPPPQPHGGYQPYPPPSSRPYEGGYQGYFAGGGYPHQHHGPPPPPPPQNYNHCHHDHYHNQSRSWIEAREAGAAALREVINIFGPQIPMCFGSLVVLCHTPHILGHEFESPEA
ncbi:unnamed protein product [Arabidopsis halleri]